MAGKVTVRVELLDGTIVQHEAAWTGGNPTWDAWEAEGAAEAATAKVRAAIAATHGDYKAKEGK